MGARDGGRVVAISSPGYRLVHCRRRPQWTAGAGKGGVKAGARVEGMRARGGIGHFYFSKGGE